MIGTLLEKLFVSVGVDLSDLRSGFRDVSRDVGKMSRELKAEFAAVGKSWQETGGKMIKTGAVMTGAITAPLVYFGKQAAQAAIDAEEMQSAFGVVFGSMAADMTKWAEATGNAMGRSTQEIQRGALAFQELFGKAMDPAKAAEMSKTFAVLTQDLASFKNLSNEAAQQKLFSGLTGEAEPLRAVGVFINEAAVKSKLLELGIKEVNGAFTDQQKIIARAAIIREQLVQADGDVIRTSDSAANRIRASQAAYEELSITVGEILVPAITPLIETISSLLEGFNKLDPGVQKFIVGGLAIAAAVGPVLVGLGGLVTTVGALMPMIGAAIPIVSGFAGALAGLVIAGSPFILIAAAIAAAGYLIYENWDKIAPILQEFWNVASEALGPPLRELISAVSTALSELWSGPLGEMIRAAGAALLEFQGAWGGALGSVLIGTIKAVIMVMTEMVKTIGDGISFVAALLSGDWRGAWEAAYSIVNRMTGGIPDMIGRMVSAIRDWMVTRLSAIWETVRGKIDQVKGWFYGLYDAVVGHSYIPDMVSEIGTEMGKLQGLMVDPAKRATESTKEAFRSLAESASSILERLFPFHAELKSILEDMATLDKARAAGAISKETYGAASDKLTDEALEARRGAREGSGSGFDWIDNPEAIKVPILELGQVIAELPRVATEAEMELQQFGEFLGNGIMGSIRDVLTGRMKFRDAIRDLFGNFLFKTITDAMKSLETAVFGEGGLGGFLGSVFSSVIKSRAVGGPTLPGEVYTVGAGEKFVPGRAGRVLSRSDAMAAAGGGGGGIGSIRVSVSGARGNAEIMDMVKAGVREGISSYDRGVGSRVQTNLRRKG